MLKRVFNNATRDKMKFLLNYNIIYNIIYYIIEVLAN